MATLKNGRKVVAVAGTPEPLSATSIAVSVVTVTAETDNTGIVVAGGATGLVAALATRTATPLAAGDTCEFTAKDGVDELGDVWLDVTVSGDGVTYTYGAI